MLLTPLLFALASVATAQDVVVATEEVVTPKEPLAPEPTARDSAPESARWDLSHVFAGVEDFEAAQAQVEPAIEALAGCEGEMSRSARRLADCMMQTTAVVQQLSRLGSYANGHANVDTADAGLQARRGEVSALWGELGETLAFREPEIVSLGAKKLERFLAAEVDLAPHAYYLRSTLRTAEHLDRQLAP